MMNGHFLVDEIGGLLRIEGCFKISRPPRMFSTTRPASISSTDRPCTFHKGNNHIHLIEIVSYASPDFLHSPKVG